MAFYIDDESLPTAAQMSEVLSYDPETGRFVWLVDVARNVKAGSEAGCVKGTRVSPKTGKENRYRYIRFGDREFPAARVAWLLHHGEWPKGNIMFKDGDTSNLRFANLSLKTVEVTVERDGIKYRTMTKDAMRHYGLKRYYGLTIAEYGKMLADQDGKCAICHRPERAIWKGKPKPLSVDHCHTTGKIRQLLCSHCNHMIGHAEDNREILLSAVEYLDKHSV
jgi:Recombination endonuclease VII/HNH endonuclease